MNKILIIKTSSLGDIVHVFPVLKVLKGLFPSVEIDWVVEKRFAELVEAHPLVHRTITIDSKKWRKAFFSKKTIKEIKEFRADLQSVNYDLLFDFQGNLKSSLPTFLAKAQNKVGFGWRSVPEWPNALFTSKRFNLPKGSKLNIRDDYLYLVKSFFNNKQKIDDRSPFRFKLSNANEDIRKKVLKKQLSVEHPIIMVCPGSIWRNKRLPREILSAFLRRIHLDIGGSFVVVWGSEEEREVASDLSTALGECCVVLDRYQLPLLQNLMDDVDVVISMDSLPLHLAATTLTPTFSIFGGSSGNKYAPVGEKHQFFQGECPYGRTFDKRCPILRSCKTGACIREVSLDALYQSFQTFFRTV